MSRSSRGFGRRGGGGDSALDSGSAFFDGSGCGVAGGFNSGASGFDGFASSFNGRFSSFLSGFSRSGGFFLGAGGEGESGDRGGSGKSKFHRHVLVPSDGTFPDRSRVCVPAGTHRSPHPFAHK